MSWLCCDDCGTLIDTDFEPEAYDERDDKWRCERCRDEREADQWDREHGDTVYAA